MGADPLGREQEEGPQDRDDEGEDQGDEEEEDEEKDGVRFRGGFSLNGGIFILPDLPDAVGGAGGLAVRLGVQINHIFSVYYQGSPMVGVITGNGGTAAMVRLVGRWADKPRRGRAKPTTPKKRDS